MHKTTQRVLAEALRLPLRDRAAVASSLLETLEPPPASLPGGKARLEEIERRARAAQAGKQGVPWEEAKARVMKRLRSE